MRLRHIPLVDERTTLKPQGFAIMVKKNPVNLSVALYVPYPHTHYSSEMNHLESSVQPKVKESGEVSKNRKVWEAFFLLDK
jgi:hypothetical protein